MIKECCGKNKCCSFLINTMGVLGILASVAVIILYLV